MSSLPACHYETPTSTDSGLLLRLQDADDSEAWHLFWCRYHRFVRRVAANRGLPPSEIDDLAQEVFLRVLESISHFERRAERGGFRKWLARQIRWRVGDWHRLQSRRTERFEGLLLADANHADTGIAGLVSPQEAAVERAAQRRLAELALGLVRNRFNLRTVQIFALHVLEGMEADEVARFFSVSRGQVYLTKHRVLPVFARTLQQMYQEVRREG